MDALGARQVRGWYAGRRREFRPAADYCRDCRVDPQEFIPGNAGVGSDCREGREPGRDSEGVREEARVVPALGEAQGEVIGRSQCPVSGVLVQGLPKTTLSDADIKRGGSN